MIPVLYEKNIREFNNNGLGSLPDWIAGTCKVIEDQSEFYLEGELPVNGTHVDKLAIDRIITAAPAPGKPVQPFRIQQISKPEGKDAVKILAPHVSYQLTQSVLRPLRFEIPANTNVGDAAGAWMWVAGIPSIYSIVGQKFFYFESDISLPSAVTFDTLTEPRFVTIREALCGMDGSIQDLVGGEFEWDNWTVRLKRNRGRATDKEIRYGRNLSGMSYDTDARAMVTAYLGYCTTTDKRRVVSNLVRTADAGDYAYPRVQVLDLTQHFQELAGEGQDVDPSQSEVQAATEAYAAAHPGNLRTSILIENVPVDLQDVYLYDTVNVIHPVYDLEQYAQISRTVFNPITEKYTELTIGEIRKDISGTIARIQQVIAAAAGSIFRK